MKLVERAEVLDLASYEEIREPFRRRIIEDKRARRIELGPNMSVLFENRDTVLFQIQEMLRTERITREAAILHEIETYNELVPGSYELSATIFVEYAERDVRERMLVALAGVDDDFYFEIDAQRVAVRPDPRATRDDRTLAVHYVKFPLGERLAQALRSGAGPAAIGVEHPAYRARTELASATLASLARDFDG